MAQCQQINYALYGQHDFYQTSARNECQSIQGGQWLMTERTYNIFHQINDYS